MTIHKLFECNKKWQSKNFDLRSITQINKQWNDWISNEFFFLNFWTLGSLHTQGPLDGSLYATILKSPKSPLKSPIFPPAFISNIVNNNYQQNRQPNADSLAIVASTPKRTPSTQSLISPPPEFSNKKLVEIKECYTTLSPIEAAQQSENREQSKTTNRSYTSTPSYEEIQVPTRSSSREATLRHQSHYQSSLQRPTSSLSVIYHQQQKPDLPLRSASVSRSGSHQPQQQLRTINDYQYSNTQNLNR